ncbi:hypothetical protein SAMN05216224_105300 [Thioclava dalianensis]|uniref:hypothetical protein n=1 Tax=Thioclava dalianensis TaxID=1185766 RepID=UPI0008F68330|nr:hypothetical protein [Thioclava dalianensis]SFN45736.1 hypothetical protein SAMN05216224_105300 [Thioclava dalianensis]
MPVIVWGVLAVAGAWGVGYAADKAGDAAGQGAKLAKWGAVAGGVYLGYRAAKAGGYLK